MVALAVALMFVIVILTDLAVVKYREWRAAHAATPAAAIAALWEIPEGVHLSGAHTWFRPDPAGGLEIGADALIVHAMGAVERIVLPKPGDQVTAGQPLFRLERDGRRITVPSTLTGKVASVNTHLAQQAGLLISDPYGRGWVCRVVPTAVGATAPSVHFGEKAILWLENEFARLGEFLAAQTPALEPVGATSLDGGLPVAGCLAELDQPAWTAFEAEFLKSR